MVTHCTLPGMGSRVDIESPVQWRSQAPAHLGTCPNNFLIACALAFACRSFKLALHVKESAHDRKRRGSEGLACLYVYNTLSTSKSFLES